jgi:hypothetical protein
MFNRAVLTDGLNGGLPKRASPGDGFMSNVICAVNLAAGAAILTVAEIAGGAVQFTALAAGANLTTPAAAAILAAAPDMNVGDAFCFKISVVPAFVYTFVAGAGVTLLGRATIPSGGTVDVVVTRTGPATVSWRVL